ncbi:MAG: large conductance mechanosensitive channel protein MscL [Lachnospiraceae bacterium]|nr:large conductance mechanosensitive channel protein MscL [Lachnospiraceae bacterium]
MKKFMAEFKEFIKRGSVIDMAVGIIIGGAFTAIVNSLVNDIITPIIGIFGGLNFDEWCVTLAGDSVLYYGKFITAVLNFLLMAIIVFCIIRSINKMKDRTKKEEEAEPTEKECPYCKMKIAIAATKCPHCTSDIPEEVEG